MSLSQQEHIRYDRHIRINEIGIDGQLKLKNTSILMIGAGGLGCPTLQYLVGAGIGTIGIIDDDIISESNLQRQILYNTHDIGKAKVEIAASRLSALNPCINIQPYKERLNTSNVINLFKNYDIIIDGTDNFESRYLINDACIALDKPLIYGAIHQFEGQISVFNYDNGPSYRCLFPEPPDSELAQNCSEIGVIGVLPGIIGSLQANEAIKIALGIGNILSETLLTFNAKTCSFQQFTFNRNDQIIDDTKKRGILDLEAYGFTCETCNTSLRDYANKPGKLIIDIREEGEKPDLVFINVLRLPLSQLEHKAKTLNKDVPTLVLCETGNRSKKAIRYLKKHFQFENLANLEGGLTANID